MQRIRIHQPKVRRERPCMTSCRPTRGTPMWSGPRRSPAPEIAPAEEQPGSHIPPSPPRRRADGIRRAVITSVRTGAATASLPAALAAANRDAILGALARRRVQVDRCRHRDRKTKARPGFPPGGPRLVTRTAPAEISICQPLTA
jgi:hypothetical protein